jgi:septal ring factor EnvC (AmiA/AmiB activator)
VLVDSDGRLGTATVNQDAGGFFAVPQGQRQAVPKDAHEAMLKVEKLQATVAQQQKQIEILTAQFKEQAAKIQKVSDQVELSKPAPRMVASDQ